MIYFFADTHFGVRPGMNIFNNLPDRIKNNCRFFENEWNELENGSWNSDCDLLILHLIGTTCGQPHPGPGAEKRVKEYLERGGNVLLLHGSSAAFWQWSWWRALPGERWVRPNDPDGVPASVHPKHPCIVKVAKSRHPLCGKLKEMDLPEDEIYINLENTSYSMRLMETAIPEGIFVQCCETISPWGGKLLSFIPGHRPEITTDPVLNENIATLVDYLMGK